MFWTVTNSCEVSTVTGESAGVPDPPAEHPTTSTAADKTTPPKTLRCMGTSGHV
jgi:hypothetical protein